MPNLNVNFDVSMQDDEQKFDVGFGNVIKVSTGNYDELYNQPEINDKTVQGKRTGEYYGLQHKMDALTVQEIERILYVD